MSRLNCCGQALKASLILANIFILILGLLTILAGSITVAVKLDLDYVTGSDAFNGAADAIAAGVVLALVGVLGMAAGCGELWGLVAFYNLCVCGLIGLGMATAVYFVSNEADISQRAQDQFSLDMSNYRLPSDTDYSQGGNNYVDLVQGGYQCCGLNAPGDWLVQNLEYCIDNLGLPDSCHCSSTYNDNCFSVTIPISPVDYLTFSSWTKGCSNSIGTMVSYQVMIAGIVSFAMFICETVMLCCGYGLCCLLMRSGREQRRRSRVHYAPIEPYHDKIVMDPETLEKPQQPAYPPEEPAYPPPPYNPASYPNNANYQTYQPV